MNEPTQEQFLIARSKLWTPELDKLLRRWKKQIERREEGHFDLAREYSNKHYFFGVPATILATICATGILSTFRNCTNCDDLTSAKCIADEWIRLVIGILGIISAGLTAFTTFMNYQKAAEEHKNAAGDYGTMYLDLDSMLLLPGPVRGDPIVVLKDIQNRYSELIRNSPALPKEYDAELTYTTNTNNVPIPPTPFQFGIDNQRKKSTTEEIEKMLNEESSDSEAEVCIGFDLDDVQNYDVQKIALHAAKVANRHDEYNRRSLEKCLDFELERLERQAQPPPSSSPHPEISPTPLSLSKTQSESHNTESSHDTNPENNDKIDVDGSISIDINGSPSTSLNASTE